MSLKHLKVFNNLSEELQSQTQIACVFGMIIQKAIIVTFNDDVYINDHISRYNYRSQFKKIDILCQKGICDFAYQHNDLIALNNCGEIFIWRYGTNIEKITIDAKIVKIACGFYHTLALDHNRQLYSWGRNENGEIGNGTVYHQFPVNIPKCIIKDNANIETIICGSYSSFALFDDGSVYSWGLNTQGQLGIGSYENQLKPCRVTSLSDIIDIACGKNHTLALSRDGIVYSWGENSHGQLGNGNYINQNVPVKVATNFISIVASHFNDISIAMSDDQKYLVWGRCDGKDITTPTEVNGVSIDEIYEMKSTVKVTPKPIKLKKSIEKSVGISKIYNALSNKYEFNITMVCVFGCDKKEIIIMTDDDDVFSINHNDSNDKSMQRIDDLSKNGIKKFSYSYGHIIGLNESGKLFEWGNDDYINMYKDTNGKVIDIACGWYHTMVLMDNGDVYSWGHNNFGQIGNGTTKDVPSPFKVKGIENKYSKIKSIVCGSFCSFALYADGCVYGWGCNLSGQLGTGTFTSKLEPFPVKFDEKIDKIVCGSRHTLALTKNGRIYAMGSNSYGQLGIENVLNVNTPKHVSYLGCKFIDIAASHYNCISVAMTEHRQCFVWGLYNSNPINTPTEIEFESIDLISLIASDRMPLMHLKLAERTQILCDCICGKRLSLN